MTNGQVMVVTYRKDWRYSFNQLLVIFSSDIFRYFSQESSISVYLHYTLEKRVKKYPATIE